MNDIEGNGAQFVVVAAIGFDDTTLAVGRAAVRAAEREAIAEVRFVHVVEPAPAPAVLGAEPPALDAEIESARRRLEALIEELAPPRPMTMTVRVLVGRPADQVVELAKSSAAGLVVVGTHGRRGVRRLVMGSVAEEVVRTAPCQVLTVRPLPVSRWARRMQRRATATADK